MWLEKGQDVQRRNQPVSSRHEDGRGYPSRAVNHRWEIFRRPVEAPGEEDDASSSLQSSASAGQAMGSFFPEGSWSMRRRSSS
ncbi:hypothetical protein VTN00DRAFT_7857 [Thermoascus crustaceus]|uniref:uncharacterized protein n=1 Tax=Thermoascus crustaceus TaxID=5088 RepID=UPI00374335A7